MKGQEEMLTLSLAEVAAHFQQKKLSPVEVTKQLLLRIEEVDPEINAFITIDQERVMSEAAEAEQEIQAGRYKGPLHGVAIGLKDLIYTKDMKTTMGSPLFADYVPSIDASVVERLQEAGAIIIGKLNTHQFAYGPTGDRSHAGPVKNPYDLTKMTGGSSSGSAAAVSACMCFGALGTDTGGSIRVPAAFCGIVGMKPTFGRVSKHGVFPLSWTLDHVGPMTRTVTDNALLLQVLTGYDRCDPYSLAVEEENVSKKIGASIKGIKVGLPSSFYYTDLHPEVRESMERSIAVLRESGAVIEEVHVPHIEQFAEAHKVILRSDAYAVHRERLAAHPDEWDDEVKERLLTGLETKGFEYAEALQIRQQAKEEFAAALQQVDVLLTPTVPILAPEINGRHVDIESYQKQHIRWSIMKLTAPTNFTGLPSLSLPSSRADNGLPIGAQLIGRPLDEALLYQIGYALEQGLALQPAKWQIGQKQSN
ncbi:amidase [Alkalihalobacillus oceani]|uniref:Amidase n=1 Tax=Halalkalibacter oceani TaxID=1653776 RepID=A0A9X2DNY7_9BACI|nr:amidase [Halalkalibacter oceani]MCM3713793.1 amidase [Halalkalibacter oceani]